MEPEESPFNTPQEMLVRAAYLACVAGFAAAIVLTVIGTLMQNLRVLGVGLGALAVAGVLREWLHRAGHFDRTEAMFRDLMRGGAACSEVPVARLMELLRECEELESRRGLPGFDPWRLLAVRHDIRELVEKHPALQRLVQS